MKLYKYFPSDRVKFIYDRLVRLTPPNAFNDPFDMLPLGKATFAEKHDTKTKTQRTFRQLSEQFLKQRLGDTLEAMIKKDNLLQAEVNRTYGVFCLSERYDSLLMWAHYANDHKGFVVEFDASHPWLKQGNQKATVNDLDADGLRKVTYSDDRPIASIFVDRESARGSFPLSQYVDSFFTKGSDWSYEREWRLLKRLGQAANRMEKSFIQDHIALFKVPSRAISSIIFGARMTEANRSILMNCRKIRDLRHVRLLQAVLSQEKFALEFIPIEVEQGAKRAKSQKKDNESSTT